MMEVLIVESLPSLGKLWSDHVCRLGSSVTLALDEGNAIERLREKAFDVIVLNLGLSGGGAEAIADYASYRRPGSKVVFVTSDSFFSDGSIFRYMPNACAMVQESTPPADLAAVVDYHGR